LLNGADSSLAPAVNPLPFQTRVGCKQKDASYCQAIGTLLQWKRLSEI